MEVHEPSFSTEIEQVFHPLGTRIYANSDSVDSYSIKACKCGDKKNLNGPSKYFRGKLTYEEAAYLAKICLHIIE